MFLVLYPLDLLKGKKLIGAGLLLLLLTGCGGSGDSSSSHDGGHAASTVSGTAYIGNEAEGTVYLKDAHGITVNTEIAENGTYSFDVDSLNAPFFLKGELRNKVSNTNHVYYSFAESAGNVSVNPLTHITVANAAGGINVDGLFDSANTAALQTINTGLTHSLHSVHSALAVLLEHYNAADANPFSVQASLGALFHQILIETDGDNVVISNRDTGEVIFEAPAASLTGTLNHEHIPNHDHGGQDPAPSLETEALFNNQCSSCHILRPDDHDHSHGTIPGLGAKGALITARFTSNAGGTGSYHAAIILTAEEITALAAYVDTFAEIPHQH